VYNDIVCAVDSGQLMPLVLLDLSSPFDTVDHDCLLTILRNRFTVVGRLSNRATEVEHLHRRPSGLVRISLAETQRVENGAYLSILVRQSYSTQQNGNHSVCECRFRGAHRHCP